MSFFWQDGMPSHRRSLQLALPPRVISERCFLAKLHGSKEPGLHTRWRLPHSHRSGAPSAATPPHGTRPPRASARARTLPTPERRRRAAGASAASARAAAVPGDGRHRGCSRKRTSVGDAQRRASAGASRPPTASRARVKRRRSLEGGTPLLAAGRKNETPAKASPGAAELGFFSPAASAKRSKAWSVRASARRADAWADHDGWFPSSKGDEAAFLALVESRGCPPAKRLEAWAAWARNEPPSCSWKSVATRRSRRKLARTSSGRCGARPTFGTATAPRYLAAFLRTRAAEDTSVGYVQGMNYVAAFCLLVARGDADADADPAPTSRDDAERAYDAFRALTGSAEATTSTASRRCTATSACLHHS